MTQKLTRRRFLQVGGGFAAGAVVAPMWLRPGGLFDVLDAEASATGKKLVVLLMAGGNDGLNTVIPYTDGTYYSKRTTDLTYPASQVLPVSADLGLNPKLPTLKSAFDAKQCAVVLGVGYPNHDLSHFGSMDVWQTGSPAHSYGSGWLGRYLDLTPANGSVVRAAAIGWGSLPQALAGDTTSGISLPSFPGYVFWDGTDAQPEPARVHSAHLTCTGGTSSDPMASAWLNADNQAFQSVNAVRSLGQSNAAWPRTLADQMGMAITMLSSNLGCDIAFLTLGSFDDHASEKAGHEPLLTAVDAAVAKFQSAVAATANPANYLLMTFSEFGRRVNENGNAGTDHGTAAPLFVVGQAVKGGIYGAQPSLTSLDRDGNMVSQVDFRQVYMPIIDTWLGGVSSQQVLGYSASDNLTAIPFI
jgi:uncharacterized protein (DUF1501 family)